MWQSAYCCIEITFQLRHFAHPIDIELRSEGFAFLHGFDEKSVIKGWKADFKEKSIA
ncbi:hypothetical protein [Bacteroides uniformis]|uniref:hypothetical protein n=1 Tax=Bacteroides uniformis TaxID=820 RepID=UPI00129CFB99|nr:hypothetical protein [Bacteroides uniformis]MBV4218004.1 hypothetical protein [Bacteroides uniformis]MCB7405810.1 hypothetical protein [Bacteroides uniformis]